MYLYCMCFITMLACSAGVLFGSTSAIVHRAAMFDLCTDQMETSTSPPGLPPGIWTFEVWVVQIPISRVKTGVPMPHLKVILGDQMPLPREKYGKNERWNRNIFGFMKK